MVSFIREIVSGKKNRLKDAKYNLDLTYIVPRIIAMSFPGSGLEITYRNNIEDVSFLIKERHGSDYQIYNLSGRSYNYAKLDNQVLDFPWEDHHSPPIHTLFQICKNIEEFLSKKETNVVAVHCLAGKGRTGTVICCFLLYSGRFLKVEDALDYYAKKRFSKGGGVTQPSQRRYVQYFGELLRNWRKTPCVKTIESITMSGTPKFSGNNGCRPYIEIYSVRENKMIYTDKVSHADQKKYELAPSNSNSTSPSNCNLNEESSIIKINFNPPFTILGDLLIRFFHNGRYKQKFMFRFAFCTAFIKEDDKIKFFLKDLDPDRTVKSDKFPKEFFVEVCLGEFCKCNENVAFDDKCEKCSVLLREEKLNWDEIYKIMETYNHPSIEASQKILFWDEDFDDFDEIVYAKECVQPLEMGNINVQEVDPDEEEKET